MPSKLKSDTARANGARSKGPKTPETRQISARNSLKHGLSSRHTILLACDDPVQFQRVVDEYTALYRPTNIAERNLVEEMIAATWRLRRLKTIEAALMDFEMDTLAPELAEKLDRFDMGIHMSAGFRSLADGSRALSLLTRYQSRLHRIHAMSLKSLLDLRRAIADGHVAAPPPTPIQPDPVVATPAAPTPTFSTSGAPGVKCRIEPTARRILYRIRSPHRPNKALSL